MRACGSVGVFAIASLLLPFLARILASMPVEKGCVTCTQIEEKGNGKDLCQGKTNRISSTTAASADSLLAAVALSKSTLTAYLPVPGHLSGYYKL